MNVTFDASDLRSLVREIVAETLSATSAALNGERLAYTEPEAAELIGIKSHQLRDARLRGEIVSTKAGGRIAYERSELVAYLARQRQE